MLNINYTSINDELTKRILSLIPEHPEILDMDNAFLLFKIPTFSCSDLNPSLAQAIWSLSNAKRIYNEGN